jgi:hypothetical protein
MTKNKKNTAPKAGKPTIAPETVEQDIVTDAVTNDRDALIAKAKAARQAAVVGLISQEEADAHWANAEAACKPSEESITVAKTARDEAAKVTKVLKAAHAALAAGLIDEDVVSDVKAKTEAAHAAYTAAAKAARGFSLSGGGPRYKGQMSGLDAAFKILSESGKPLNPTAILKAAMEQGLWCPEGATPVATLGGALQTDVKKGEKARFAKVGKGLYAIR